MMSVPDNEVNEVFKESIRGMRDRVGCGRSSDQHASRELGCR